MAEYASWLENPALNPNASEETRDVQINGQLFSRIGAIENYGEGVTPQSYQGILPIGDRGGGFADRLGAVRQYAVNHPQYGWIIPSQLSGELGSQSYTGSSGNFLNKLAGYMPQIMATALTAGAASGALGGLTAAEAGAGAAAGGAGATGAGLAGAEAAGAAGVGFAAPAGSSFGGAVAGGAATAAQTSAIADLVATGMSQEAATTAVMSGTAQGIGGAGTGIMAGSTPLSRLLGLGQTGSDWLSLAGQLAPGVLGYLGADKQSDAYRDVANQYLNIGAPYRNTLEQSYQPGFDLMSQPGYGDALARSGEIAARSASAKYGNPGENPGAMADITRNIYGETYLPALANYRGQLGQFGGLGLNTAGLGSLGGANVAGGQYDAIGVGLGRAMTPNPFEDFMRQYGQGQYGDINLSIGGRRQ